MTKKKKKKKKKKKDISKICRENSFKILQL